jgi:VWFA-related protein
MTSEVDKLTSAVSHLHPGGDTALHDAMVRASEDLRSSRAFYDARKIIIVLSDGADTVSHFSAKDCSDAAIASEATIVVVDASVPSEHNSPGQVFLREIAENSGGFVLPARLDSELKSAFHTIEQVLRNQYSLSYKPALFQRNGVYRSIDLRARKHGLKVHARTGYFAKSD